MMRVLSDTTWSPRKIWNCFDIVNGATPASGTAHFWDGEISWVGPADLGKLSSRVISRGERNLTESGYKSCGTTFVPAGTIILSARAPIGHVAVAANRLCFNQGCKGLVPNADIFGEFAYWLILALKPKLEAAGQGTTFVELSRNKLKDVTFLLPPLPEQRAIAVFLDGKCATIDEAVRIKEKQIRLLVERRQILIQQAVTRGLNPNAPMKDSGIDWIGQIPAHWSIAKLKFLTNKIVDGTHFTPEYLDEGIPFLRVTDLSQMKEGKIQWDSVRRISMNAHKELSKRANAEFGDVLLSKNGTIGLTKVIDWQDEFSFFVSLCLIKLRSELNAHYFEAFFNSPLVDQQLFFGSFRTSVTNLHLERIKELLIVVPPIEEQSELVAHISEISSPLDEAIALKKTQITALREYKTSLINAAVTGKIKVL